MSLFQKISIAQDLRREPWYETLGGEEYTLKPQIFRLARCTAPHCSGYLVRSVSLERNIELYFRKTLQVPKPLKTREIEIYCVFPDALIRGTTLPLDVYSEAHYISTRKDGSVCAEETEEICGLPLSFVVTELFNKYTLLFSLQDCALLAIRAALQGRSADALCLPIFCKRQI